MLAAELTAGYRAAQDVTLKASYYARQPIRAPRLGSTGWGPNRLAAAVVVARAPTIVFYISGHGLGHASRSIELIEGARRRRPDARLVVRTAAPSWLFRATARNRSSWRQSRPTPASSRSTASNSTSARPPSRRRASIAPSTSASTPKRRSSLPSGRRSGGRVTFRRSHSRPRRGPACRPLRSAISRGTGSTAATRRSTTRARRHRRDPRRLCNGDVRVATAVPRRLRTDGRGHRPTSRSSHDVRRRDRRTRGGCSASPTAGRRARLVRRLRR